MTKRWMVLSSMGLLACVSSVRPGVGQDGGGKRDSSNPLDGQAPDSSIDTRPTRDSAIDTKVPPDSGPAPDAAAREAGVDATSTSDAGLARDGGTSADGGTPSRDAGISTCLQPSTDHVWATITTASGPTIVRAVAAGEIWGISVGKLQRWNGTDWTAVAVPFTWATTVGVVGGSSATNVWVTNGAGVIARWDGAGWTDGSPTGLPAGSRVSQLVALDPRDVWILDAFPLVASGNTYSQTEVFHWDGSNWTQIALPSDAQPVATLGALWATSPNDVWMGGDVIQPTVSQYGVLLHWDGAAIGSFAFGPFPGGGQQIVDGIWGGASDDVWVAGGSTTIGAKLSHYDGAAWTEVAIPSAQGIFTGVWGWCSANVWATSSGGIWHYDGTIWSQSSDNLDFFTTISGTGADDVWASGTDGVGKVLQLRWQSNTCGDQAVGPGEQCDPPGSIGTGGALCDSTCHIPTCGNLVIDPGEECDPPNNTTCDGQCQSIPIVCGNGIVQPGESCEFGSGSLCQNCQLTTCGQCFAAVGGGARVCDGLDPQDTASCNALVACMAPVQAQCAAAANGALSCFCSDSTCSAGANRPCASQFEALAHSTDPASVISQIADVSTPVGRVAAAMVQFSHSSCGRSCSQM